MSTEILETKTAGKWRSVLFALLSISISSLIGLIIADKFAGVLLSRQVNLVFPANTSVTCETGEFKYTAKINSMGFRDRQVTPKVAGKKRIVVIGDSFVYGWGVEIEQAWPKVLEAELNSAGQNVEVFDLGCPGYGPTEYAQVAKQAIPALSPDLVIVAVLQGDDIMQEHIKIVDPPVVKPTSLHRRVADFVAPNIVALLTGHRHLLQADLPESSQRGAYKNQVKNMLESFTPEQRAKLDSMDRQAYQMWLDGELNPYIMVSAVKSPDYFAFTLQPDREDVKQAAQRVGSCLEEIHADAKKVGAEEIVVTVPFDTYVAGNRVQKFGFIVPDSAQHGTAQDDVIATAAKQAGANFYSFTDAFRRAADKQKLYFAFDGHFTPAGHQLFADEVAHSCFELKK